MRRDTFLKSVLATAALGLGLSVAGAAMAQDKT